MNEPTMREEFSHLVTVSALPDEGRTVALQASEGEQLNDLAQELGRVLMVGHLLEYHPAVVRLHELVDAGELGNVNYIYSNRLNFGKVRTEENALWSFAPHDVAVKLRLFGEMPVEVTCAGGSYLTPGLAVVTVSTLLVQSGRRAHIFVSWLHPFKEHRLVIIGSEGMLSFEDSSEEKALKFYQKKYLINEKGDLVKFYSSSIKPLSNEIIEFITNE